MEFIHYNTIHNYTIKELKDYILTRPNLSPEYYINPGYRYNTLPTTLLSYLSFETYDYIDLYDFVKWLLINGANPNSSCNNWSVLTLLSVGYDMKNNKTDFTELLLKYGADTNTYDGFKYTLLFRLITRYDFIKIKKIVKIIIDNGAKLSIFNSFYNVKAFENFCIDQGDDLQFANNFYDNYDINIQHTDNIFERLWKDLEISTKKRRINKFLLKYVVLNPKSKYIQRMVNEFN
jgi:hypothetical protein